MSEIKAVFAREILDSRGNPTVEVEVETVSGTLGRASVPSGASTGEHEAVELRDRDKKRFGGQGVLSAVHNVEDVIGPEICGMDVLDQNGIDQEMIELDGTNNKEHLGANAVLGVSLACARAAAAELGMPLYRYIGGVNAKVLPVPMINIFNGGMHSSSRSAIQEYMIRPVGAESFPEAMQMGAAVFSGLKRLLEERRWSTAVGDEGGFAPPELQGGAEAVLELIVKAIEKAGFTPGEEITIAIDAAASSFYRSGLYDYRIFEGENAAVLDGEGQIEFLGRLLDRFPIDSIEDGAGENDWECWEKLTAALGKKCQLVGDDLFVTNTAYLQQGIDRKCANAILIKPNQTGTLTEVCDTAAMALANSYKCIISHRSGETCDPFIADLAVGLGTGQIKAGSLARGERLAKYNQLLRIDEQLGNIGRYGNIF
ncbi:MAG: phosphopyruvate hydratase [Lentisphaeria bacterium]|nr:phosphopyruvate hydratase [Lentisphaeria bacterium]